MAAPASYFTQPPAQVLKDLMRISWLREANLSFQS